MEIKKLINLLIKKEKDTIEELKKEKVEVYTIEELIKIINKAKKGKERE